MLFKIRDKLQGLPIRKVGEEGLLRTGRQIARTYRRIFDSPSSTYVTDPELEQSLVIGLAEVAESIRHGDRLCLTPGLRSPGRTAALLEQHFPGSVEETRAEAKAILAHRVRVFETDYDLGHPIDWHADPATGHRWPNTHYTRVPIRSMPGSDVRAIWELNRLYHFTALGRAYALTGDERYTGEFLVQFSHWYESNPPRFGPNWLVAMEAAIRAINVIAAFNLFSRSPLLSNEAITLLLKALLAHGRFIRTNLEFSHATSSNHYLSDLLGLFAIGMTVPEFRESEEWVQHSAEELMGQMEKQVLPDGVDYEGSTGYHRLALEIYALFFTICHASQLELSGEYWERLESMFDFVRHYLKPDGTAPLIGDSDDGRILRFRSRPSVDHSYLMSIAAILLENEIFKRSNRIDEEAIWWFGNEGSEAFEGLGTHREEPSSAGFPDSQIFIQRTENLYAIVDCGDHGVGGRGSHAHSDALSLEIHCFGKTFLRDPGSFVYTASEQWRNAFRSTPYHNTARVDGHEISAFGESELFSMGPNVRPIVNRWEVSQQRDVLDAEHHGFRRLENPVVHRRILTLDKEQEYWTLEDLFTGEGSHRIELFFNFDSGIELEKRSRGSIIAHGGDSGVALIPVSDDVIDFKTLKRWVSLSYGTRNRAYGIIYRFYRDLPFENMVLLIPFRTGDEGRIERVLRAHGVTPLTATHE